MRLQAPFGGFFIIFNYLYIMAFRRPCYVKVGDLVRTRGDLDIYGYVTYIDGNSETGEYYVEIVFDEDADPLYFYDDQLEVLTVIKE